MRAGEVFYRAGASLGGWFIAYGHALLIAVIPSTTCATREAPNELWFASALLALPTAAAVLWLIPTALPWRESFRWLALPLAPLLVYNATIVLPYLRGATFGASSLCAVLEPGGSAVEPALWEPAWAPVQLLLGMGAAYRCFEYWRRNPH